MAVYRLMGGWATFVIALMMIGLITALIGDMAELFGCVIGLKVGGGFTFSMDVALCCADLTIFLIILFSRMLLRPLPLSVLGRLFRIPWLGLAPRFLPAPQVRSAVTWIPSIHFDNFSFHFFRCVYHNCHRKQLC